MDEYSSYLVNHQLLPSMNGNSLDLAGQTTIDKVLRGKDGLPLEKPQIRSDNCSGCLQRVPGSGGKQPDDACADSSSLH